MRGGIAAGIVSLVAIVVLLPNDPGPRAPSEDAGVFFYAARALQSGGTPYVDVWDHKPPLVYFIDALGLAIAGPTGVWLLQLAALVLAALLGLRAMSAAFGLAAATFGSIAWLVALPRLFLRDGEQTAFVELFALPLQFATLALVARRPDVRFTRGEAIAIGAFAALAVLLKPTLIGVWVALVAVLAWRERARAIGPVIWAALAGAVVLAAVALFFAMRGALDDMLEQALRYNAAYSSFAPLGERLAAIPEGVRLLSPSGLAPLALLTFAYALAAQRSRGTKGMRGSLFVVALVALPLEMLLATAGRAYNYYFITWLPVMGVLAACAAAEARTRLAPTRAAAVLAVAVLLMAIQPARLVVRLAAIGDDGGSRAAAAFLDERTARDDRVVVWGSHAEVFILADRRSPTRYVYQYAALATRGYATPAAVDELLADLAAHPPVYIIDASANSFVTPPLDRAAMRAWVSPESQYAWLAEAERIAAFVETNYVREGALPVTGWPAFRRR